MTFMVPMAGGKVIKAGRGGGGLITHGDYDVLMTCRFITSSSANTRR